MFKLKLKKVWLKIILNMFNFMACTSTGHFLSFNTKDEFDSFLLYVDNNMKASENAYKIIEWDYLTAGILLG